MALCYTRLLCRRNPSFQKLRGLYTSSTCNVATTKALRAASDDICETHDERNARLKRPMSPHLSIYQVQLTSMLSITHRATGMIVTGYLGFIGLGSQVMKEGFPCLLEALDPIASSMSSPTLFAVKTIIALPVTYHVFNGIRHLIWDWTGKSLSIKGVYTSGYIVVALSVLSALGLGAM